MSYYSDRDEEIYIDNEVERENEIELKNKNIQNCTNKSCINCMSYYTCNTVKNTIEVKPFYIVERRGMYLMSRRDTSGKWFTRDINKARKFKKISTAKRQINGMENIGECRII